jgi:hypothetical protein
VARLVTGGRFHFLRGAHHQPEPVALRGISPGENAERGGYPLIRTRGRADELVGRNPERGRIGAADQDGVLLLSHVPRPWQASQVGKMIAR